MDVATAFDTINHGDLTKALAQRGMRPNLVRALLREVSFMKCNTTLPGASPSDRFPMCCGGKQGGIETPEEFNVMIEFVLQPLVDRGRHERMGFCFGEDDERPLSHLIWADNVILIAKSPNEFNQMAQELTDAICSIGFQWKRSSLEAILCGPISRQFEG